jgi:hypothetical protein
LRERVGAESGPQAAINRLNMGVMATPLGLYDEALALLEPAPAALQALGPMWSANASNHLAALWLVLGQVHRAAACLVACEGDAAPLIALRRATLRARLQRQRPGADAAVIAQALEAELVQLQPLASPKNLAALRLELSRVAPQARALALARQVRRDALAAGLRGLALHALLREADLLLDQDPGRAAELARQLQEESPGLVVTDGYVPELGLVCARAAMQAGEPAAALAAARQAQSWVEAAAGRLPAGLRRIFREENPINRALGQWLQAPR